MDLFCCLLTGGMALVILGMLISHRAGRVNLERPGLGVAIMSLCAVFFIMGAKRVRDNWKHRKR